MYSWGDCGHFTTTPGRGGDLRVKPAQMEAEPTEVFVPRMKTEETSSIPGPFTSHEQVVLLFFKASLVD